MIYMICLLSFLTILFVILSMQSILLGEKATITSRLESIGKGKTIDNHDELNLPLYNRIIKPVLNDINHFVSNMMPSKIKEKFEQQLTLAGNPFGFTVDKWVNFQIFLLAGFPILTLVLAAISKASMDKLTIIISLEIGVGILMPRLMIKNKIEERRNSITKALPDVLDLLTVSVEAGLGFDAALSRVVEKMPGPLSNELNKVLQEIKVGNSRREALKNLTKRVNVPDLTTFVGSIIQADQLGVSIGNVLRIQSQQMRQKRRQRAQEKAMKAPVKMLFPMVFFIFPTIFAVLLGPVVIKMINNFMK